MVRLLHLYWWYYILSSDLIGSIGFDVSLNAPNYVIVGSTVLLKCNYTVHPELLHKVEWMKNSTKFFQYVKERKPPFRNYSLIGATVDKAKSSERQVLLKDVNQEASGLYSCEVSTDTPIYTKSSDYHEIFVLERQKQAPSITYGKLVYVVGEKLYANCSSNQRKPKSHLVWFINGIKAETKLVKNYRGHIAELQIEISEEHLQELKLTCTSAIPAYSGNHWKGNMVYVDLLNNSISIVVLPNITEPEVRISSTGPMISCSFTVNYGPGAYLIFSLIIFSKVLQ